MPPDSLLQMAIRARTDPRSVVSDLKALTAPEREVMLTNIQSRFAIQSFRSYTPHINHALQQLVANEWMAGPAAQDWKTFFDAKDPGAAQFARAYHRMWREAHRKGVSRFFAQPEMLAYVLQTVREKDGAANEKLSLLLVVSNPTVSVRKGQPLDVMGHGVAIYVCGAYDITEEGRRLLAEQVAWVGEMGYGLPAAVAVSNVAGGYHYYNGVMCAQQRPDEMNGKNADNTNAFYVAGHAVRIGMPDPDREPCTARHELAHVIYGQMKPPTRKKIEALYKQAMQPGSDFGLIFNDEFYMHRYLHAGHPMLNDSEFFAGAVHAYTHHREELIANINAPATPRAVRSYALTTLKVLDQELKTK